jgi:hypothetical protein
MMKEALTQVETAFPKEMAWKINLYRGYLAICHPEDPHLATVDRYVEVASALCIKVQLNGYIEKFLFINVLIIIKTILNFFTYETFLSYNAN